MPRHAAAVVSYVLLWFVCLWPQSADPAHRVGYVGDSLEAVYIVAWNGTHIATDPARLGQLNAFYPAKNAMTTTDPRLLPSLLVAPVLWASQNAVLAYNAAVLLAYLLAAMTARWAASHLDLGLLAAWAVGALYAFNTFQINEAPRLHVIFHGFFPLAVVGLVNHLRGKGARWAWLAAGAGLGQALSSNYHALYLALVLTLIVVAGVAVAVRAVLPRLRGLLLPLMVAAGLVAPIALPYLKASRTVEYRHELPSGIDLLNYLTTPPTNVFYGHIGRPFRLQQRGPHFVGFVTLALVGIAVVDWLARRRRGVVPEGSRGHWWLPAALAFAVFLVLLSCGKDIAIGDRILGPGPYRILYDWVPGFQMVRIPERFGLLAMFFIGTVAGAGIDALRFQGLRKVAVILAVLAPIEHIAPLTGGGVKSGSPQTTRIPVWNEVPDVYRWLRAQPVQALAEFPPHGSGLIRKETLEMYYSTFHWKPIIHGYETFVPPLTATLRGWAENVPRSAAVQRLAACGVDTFILHAPPPELLAPLSSLPGPEQDRMIRVAAEVEVDLPLRSPGYYRRFAKLAERGDLIELARFEAPAHAVRVPGGVDIVYRVRDASPTPCAVRTINGTWR